MEEYWVVEYVPGYGISIQHARRLNDNEKKEYAEWYREKGFVGISNAVELDNISWEDLQDNNIRKGEPDGTFNGCYNEAYIISEDKKNMLLKLNEEKSKTKKALILSRKIQELEKTIKACENQGKLYTEEEAKKRYGDYNNVQNEGGYGYVPHFYTIQEYEYAKNELKTLQATNET